MDAQRVLVVSREASLREALPDACRKVDSGFSIDATTHIHQALQKLADQRYDAVVCSVTTPDELSWIIRIKKTKPEVPVVLLTSVDDPEFRRLGEQLGAEAVLSRPQG